MGYQTKRNTHLHVHSLVLLASDVRNAILVHPSISSIGITSVARTSGTAVDQHLNGGNDISHGTYTSFIRKQTAVQIILPLEEILILSAIEDMAA